MLRSTHGTHGTCDLRGIRSMRGMRGFTLIELVVTLALLGVLSMGAVPLVEVTYTRMKEAELRRSLRVIRTALDEYRAAVDAGLIARRAGDSGFPPNLDALTQPQPLLSARAGSGDDGPRTMVLLRRLPRDPFHPDASVPPAQTWKTRRYGSLPDEWELDGSSDVFDLASKSDHTALDGTRYDSW